MYGTLPPAFCKALAPFIKGQRVVDLGCGDMGRTDILRRLDPAVILAVDKDLQATVASPELHPLIIPLKGYFKDVVATVRVFAPTVAHIAWPPNAPMPGLTDILALAPTVIYVGCNTDGSSCGDTPMIKHLLGRKLVLYLPEKQNSLIIVTTPLDRPRKPTPEEAAALDTQAIKPFTP